MISDFISAPGLGARARPPEPASRGAGDPPLRPARVDLPDVGPLLVEDAETGEQLYVDTGDRGFRQRFAEAAGTREPRSRHVREPGVDAWRSRPTRTWSRAIVRMAALRRRRRLTDAFIWPPCSCLLLLIPLGVARVYSHERRRRRGCAAAGLGALPATGVARPPRRRLRRRLPGALLLVGLVVLVVALARPQAVVSVPARRAPSSSPSTCRAAWPPTDLQPTRMEAAKAAATAFVAAPAAERRDRGRGVQRRRDVGPGPDRDQAAVLAAIDRLGPQRGNVARPGASRPRSTRSPRPTRTRRPATTRTARRSRPPRRRLFPPGPRAGRRSCC